MGMCAVCFCLELANLLISFYLWREVGHGRWLELVKELKEFYDIKNKKPD